MTFVLCRSVLVKVYHAELLRVGQKNPNFDPNAKEVAFETFKIEFTRCVVMSCLAMLKYMPAIYTTKVLDTQTRRDEKGETLTYATLRLWKRVFERIADYQKQGAFKEI